MLLKATTIALVGALAVSAFDKREIVELVTRQISESDIPSSCQSTCSSALSIYDACLNNDLNTCMTVCESDTYSNFVKCFQCIVDNTDGVSSSEVSSLNSAIGQLESACSNAGKSVPATSLTLGGSGSGGATASGTSAGSTATRSSSLTFTSNTAGQTIGASASGFASAAASATAALSSVAGEVASSAAASASAGGSSGGAVGNVPNVANALAFSLIALGAGAALVL